LKNYLRGGGARRISGKKIRKLLRDFIFESMHYEEVIDEL